MQTEETTVMMSNRLILELERLSFKAWPAAVTRNLGGWQIRFNWKVTRRANSVWPNADDNRLELADKLFQVEEFYAHRDCRPRYQICSTVQPPNLDAIMESNTLAQNLYTQAGFETIYHYHYREALPN